MSESTSITALGAKYALGMIDAEQLATLDRRTRREVEAEAMKMTRAAMIQMRAMDAAAAIHIHTTYKVGSTLSTAEFIKALRPQNLNCPELKQLDDMLRTRFLEAANYSSTDAIRKVLAELE